RLLVMLEWLSYRLANHVIVTNESAYQIALSRGKLPESKVTIVRNGPDWNSQPANNCDSDLRSRFHNIIVFAGVTGFQDGLDKLMDCLKCLRYELGREDFYCIVMGDGDALDHTKSLAREFQLEEKIWFTGWVSDSNLYARYLGSADICVSP